MYRKSHDGQLDIFDFILPIGDHLKADNRWVLDSEKSFIKLIGYQPSHA